MHSGSYSKASRFYPFLLISSETHVFRELFIKISVHLPLRRGPISSLPPADVQLLPLLRKPLLRGLNSGVYELVPIHHPLILLELTWLVCTKSAYFGVFELGRWCNNRCYIPKEIKFIKNSLGIKFR